MCSLSLAQHKSPEVLNLKQENLRPHAHETLLNSSSEAFGHFFQLPLNTFNVILCVHAHNHVFWRFKAVGFRAVFPNPKFWVQKLSAFAFLGVFKGDLFFYIRNLKNDGK